MAHSILGTKFAQQDQRKAPWHDIQGAVLRPESTVSEALGMVDGDFLVERAPLYVYYDNKGIKMAGLSALVRPALPEDPEVRILGTVGDDYELMQHGDVARALDPLVKNGWAVETLGILHQGAQFFVTFYSGGFLVNEDDIDVYWVMSETKAKSSFDIFSATTRVVCRNTYRIAESRAIESLKIPHFRGAAQELDFAVQVLAAAQAHKYELKQQLEQMGRTTLLDRQVTEILERVYPDPAPPRRMKIIDDLSKGDRALVIPENLKAEYEVLAKGYVGDLDRTMQIRDATYERYDLFNQERPHYAGTAWAVWNAVTEVENHKKGKGRGVSTLFGSRADTMQRAYSVLLESTN
jgi:hypothetical protein